MTMQAWPTFHSQAFNSNLFRPDIPMRSAEQDLPIRISCKLHAASPSANALVMATGPCARWTLKSYSTRVTR